MMTSATCGDRFWDPKRCYTTLLKFGADYVVTSFAEEDPFRVFTVLGAMGTYVRVRLGHVLIEC